MGQVNRSVKGIPKPPEQPFREDLDIVLNITSEFGLLFSSISG
jgi:hypothetical protein